MSSPRSAALAALRAHLTGACVRILVLVLASGTCLSLTTSDVRAQDISQVSVRAMTARWHEGAPLLNFSARDFMDKEVKKKLESGLPQRIVTRVYAYPERGDRPIALTAASCRVVYDLWEAVYRVEEQTPAIDRARTTRDPAEALATCLEPKTLALGDRAAFAKLAGRRVYFGVIIELNPLSADTVQRIRRWLSRAGGELGGDAFFGSFVSIFVSRQLGAAERAFSFRSVLHTVP
jgi:hypothetical protein